MRARCLSNTGKAAEAIPMFEKYLQRVPNDLSAKKALANAYRAAGQVDKAQALEKELVAAGGGGGRCWSRGGR